MFYGIVHHDDVPHTIVHDVVGLDNHGDAQNHVSNQHVDVYNNNDIAIDDNVAHEIMDRSIFQFEIPHESYFLPPVIDLDEYVLPTDGGEHECYKEVMEYEYKDQRIESMQNEMKYLQ